MGVLDGKVAVITGGTRGLGLAIAEAFAAAGAAVVLGSRSQDAVAAAVCRVAAAGAKASGLPIDVGRMGDVEVLAAHAVRSFGPIDIWVNNAGVAGPYGPTLGLAPEAFQRVLQTNVVGVYNGSRVAVLHFLARGSGKLINVLGNGYNRPLPWQNAYGSSKAWIRSFTLALAKETKDCGVGVFAFHPGLMLTDLVTDLEVVEGHQARLAVFPAILRMWAKPPEVPARRAVWLASSATDGKTGLTVRVSSPWSLLAGAAREGARALLGRPARPIGLHVSVHACNVPSGSHPGDEPPAGSA